MTVMILIMMMDDDDDDGTSTEEYVAHINHSIFWCQCLADLLLLHLLFTNSTCKTSPSTPPAPPVCLFPPTRLPFLSVSVVIGGRAPRLLGDEQIVADRLSVSVRVGMLGDAAPCWPSENFNIWERQFVVPQSGRILSNKIVSSNVTQVFMVRDVVLERLTPSAPGRNQRS